jgi:hypothetical protein
MSKRSFARILAPMISSVYFTGISADRAFLAVATAFICFGATIALHYVAWRHLEEMDQ